MDQEKKSCIRVNIRELDRVSSTELSTLYTLSYWSKLLVYTTVPLTYPKGHALSLRSICIKHVIVVFSF